MPCFLQEKKNELRLRIELTQVSDCVVVSSEISPAGVINIVNYCWLVALTLLIKGVMVRGYITRGSIYHKGAQFLGTGYHSAYQKESGVTAFKKEADERGTPFIEVDSSVSSYVASHTDSCVQKMFGRVVKRDGELAAIFPFSYLKHSIMIAGFGVLDLDLEKERKGINIARVNILDLKRRIESRCDPENRRAYLKIRHYISALDDQLLACDRSERLIDSLYRR